MSETRKHILNDTIHNETRLRISNQGDPSGTPNSRIYTIDDILNDVWDSATSSIKVVNA